MSHESIPASSELPAPDSRLLTQGSGLICLKGGDLAAEIRESGTRPRVVDVTEIFSEEFFKEKFLLYVTR